MVETHPVDQILILVRYFRERIPSLSLLASSWQHFQDIFERETQKIDLAEAQMKHTELDEKLRQRVRDFMADGSVDTIAKISDEEQMILEILVKHKSPRRQLFWAYQSRARYPGLKKFLEDNKDLMLAVTNSGHVLSKFRS